MTSYFVDCVWFCLNVGRKPNMFTLKGYIETNKYIIHTNSHIFLVIWFREHLE